MLVRAVVPHDRVPGHTALLVVAPLVAPPDDVADLERVLPALQVPHDAVAVSLARDHEVHAATVPVVRLPRGVVAPHVRDRMALVGAVPDDAPGGLLCPSGDAVRDEGEGHGLMFSPRGQDA